MISGENKKNKVICVLGMHRSGTSMVMRILNICGVYLGKEDELLGSGIGNEKGHWENSEVLNINDNILKIFGGSWDNPPKFPNCWEDDYRLSDLKKRAIDFVDKMNVNAKIWGFKEPRTCLTFPFWKKIIPEIICVIPFRRSLEVAISLNKRDGIEIEKGLFLWKEYWLNILRNTEGERRIFSVQKNYFKNWEKELRKIIDFIGIDEINFCNKEEEIDKFILPSLNHNRIEDDSVLNKKEERDDASFLSVLIELGYIVDIIHESSEKKDEKITEINKIVQEKNEELKLREEEIERMKNEMGQKEKQLALLKLSKYFKLRKWVERIKFVMFHPLKFLEKYMAKLELLLRAFLFTIRREGFVAASKRTINYIYHGKGFLEKNENTIDELYEKWIDNIETKVNRVLYENIDGWVNELEYQPKISIVMPVYNSDEIFLRKAIFSIIYQHYQNWELVIVNDCSTKKIISSILSEFEDRDKRIKVIGLEKNSGISIATNKGVEVANGEYVGFVDHDDELVAHAIYEFVKILNKDKSLDLIYSDDDKIDENGCRYDPQFKPDWSPELLLSYCYISHFKIVRKDLFLNIGGFRREFDGAQDYDFLLRLSENTNKIGHVSKILYHWRSLPGSVASSTNEKPLSVERGKIAVQEALNRRGIKGKAIIPNFAEKSKVGIYEIKFDPKDYNEKVTIIIPTKDRVDLLKRCIGSIKKKTDYLNYEILVINNNSQEKETAEYLKKEKVKFVDINNGVFNFSHINNKTVDIIDSNLILFLNNDTEVISSSWLLDLVGTISMDNKIGAVGSKLLYSDRRVQHAGIILGLNGSTAGHANKLLDSNDVGYLHYASVMRNYSAVTAACMLTRKNIFNEVDGFDEKNLAVSYNDVDYCLKLVEKGYRVVFNPSSLLYHHEGRTRGFGDSIKELDYFKAKWKKYISNDPYYNLNLSNKNEKFTINYE